MVTELHQETFPSLLIQVREAHWQDGQLKGFLPLSLIESEDELADQDHVRQMVESIRTVAERRKTSGQLTEISLGEVPGRNKFLIIDGFHRVPALELIGRTEGQVSIIPNCTEEEIIDLRIVNGATHRTLRSFRLIKWVQEFWQHTSWCQRISATQAFGLASDPGISGIKLGLSPEEALQVKQLVENKSIAWGLKPITIRQHLEAAERVDGRIIKKIKEGFGGKKFALTFRHAAVIGRQLPGEERYPLQNLVVAVVEEEHLRVDQTAILARLVADAGGENEARQLIASGNWKSLVFELKLTLSGEKSQSSLVARLINEYCNAQIELARLRLQLFSKANVHNDKKARSQAVNFLEDEKERIKLALPFLSSDRRNVIVLRVFLGKPYIEIAQVLDKSVDDVKVLMHKARVNSQRISVADFHQATAI